MAKLEEIPEHKGLYLTIHPELSPNTDILRIVMIKFCIVLQGRVLLEELILSIPLSRRAIFRSILPRANTGCSVYCEIHWSKMEILKELNFNIPFLRLI